MANGWPTPQSGFARGLSSGFELGSSIVERRQRAEAERLARERQKRLDDMQMGDAFKKRLGEAATITDPKAQRLYLNSLFKGMEKYYGSRVPEGIRALSSDPQKFQQALQMADQQGLTMRDMWQLAGDPVTFADALLAFEQVGQAAATREATTRSALVSPTVGAEPSPGDPNAALIQSYRNSITELNMGIANASAAGADAKLIESMTRRKDALEKELTDLMTIGTRARATGREQRLAPEAWQKVWDSFPALRPFMRAGFIYPGQPLGEYEDVFKRVMGAPPPASTPQPQAPQPRTAPTPAEGPVITPLREEPIAPPAPLPSRPGTPFTGIATGPMTKQEAELETQPTSDTVLRATGAATRGQLIRGLAAGTIQPQSIDKLIAMDTEIQARARQQAEVYGKAFGEMLKDREKAQYERLVAQTMLEFVNRAGPTGRWLTSIRDTFNNLVNTLAPGLKPEGMDDLQLLQSFGIRMAIDSLQTVGGNDSDKDFLHALRSNPGAAMTREANLVALMYKIETAKLREIKAINAERWIAESAEWHGGVGGLDKKDPKTGLNFNQTWDAWLARPENSINLIIRKALGVKDEAALYEMLKLPVPKRLQRSRGRNGSR